MKKYFKLRDGIIVIPMLALLTGCGATRYVPVETVRTEYRDADTTAIYARMRTLLEATIRREASSDSVIDRQKETVVIKENGDTARHETERTVYVSSRREKELESTVARQDSVIDSLRAQLASAKVDSVAVPYPVERELTRWERTKMDAGGMAIIGGAVLLVATIALLVWMIKLKRKR